MIVAMLTSFSLAVPYQSAVLSGMSLVLGTVAVTALFLLMCLLAEIVKQHATEYRLVKQTRAYLQNQPPARATSSVSGIRIPARFIRARNLPLQEFWPLDRVKPCVPAGEPFVFSAVHSTQNLVEPRSPTIARPRPQPALESLDNVLAPQPEEIPLPLPAAPLIFEFLRDAI